MGRYTTVRKGFALAVIILFVVISSLPSFGTAVIEKFSLSTFDGNIAFDPNNPPYEPSNPDPPSGATNVSIGTGLSWSGGDPDGDPVTYDVYFGITNPPTWIFSNISVTTIEFACGLDYDTTYYWKIIAWDNHGASTSGPIWNFTTASGPEPDLYCEGSLCWTDVRPGATVTSTFTVENVGDPGTLLDWEITEWPDWGTWSFIPSNGIGLMPEDWPVMVEVEVVAPDEPLSEYGGRIKIVNLQNPNDFCFIELSLITSSNFQDNFARISHQSPLLEMMKNHFPLIYQIFIEFLF